MRTFEVECPRGWSDWENSVRVVIKSFEKIGIKATESLVDYGVWKQNLVTGEFDFSMETQTPVLWPSTPWRRFAQIMSGKDLRPVGESIYENFGRYDDAEAERLIRELPRLTDENEIAAAHRALSPCL